MVGWRTAGAGRTEDGKERDPNQSSSKMDGARRGMEKRRRRRREGSIGVEVLRRMQEEGRSAWKKGGFNRSCEGKNGWRSSRLLGSPPCPASSISGAVIGLGTVRCPAVVCPMSPVKRGCIWGRGKAVGPLCPLGAAWLNDCLPGCLPAGCLAGWTSISVGWRVQLDAH